MKKSDRPCARRYYYPWNPLQLSAEVDGGWRVAKNSASFDTYRTFRRKLIWSVLLHKSLLVFHGDENDEYSGTEQLASLVKSFSKQADKSMKGTLTHTFYDFDGAVADVLAPLDEQFRGFTVQPYEESFQHFLDELVKHRERVRANTRLTKLPEAPNKRLQLISFVMDKNMVSLLRNNVVVRGQFFSLLQESARERMYFMVFMADAENFPQQWVDSFSQVFFLGESNSRIARDVWFPKLPVGKNSFAQELVGYGLEDMPPKELLSLHPTKYTKSEWKKAKESEHAAEEEMYRKFLLSLEDGHE